MKTSIKIIVATAVLGTLGLGSLARSVYASQSKPAVAIMPQNQSNTQIAEVSDGDGEVPDATEASMMKQQQPSMVNSTPPRPSMVNSNPTTQRRSTNPRNEQARKKKEQQEASQLQSLAKITPQQAQQAALTAQGGIASRVTLDNENGNLVYKVIIGQKEVAVDAGNAKVLYIENVNQPDNAATEANRPKSSIQVPNNQPGERQGRQQSPRVR